jgi:hypothetical protein
LKIEKNEELQAQGQALDADQLRSLGQKHDLLEFVKEVEDLQKQMEEVEVEVGVFILFYFILILLLFLILGRIVVNSESHFAGRQETEEAEKEAGGWRAQENPAGKGEQREASKEEEQEKRKTILNFYYFYFQNYLSYIIGAAQRWIEGDFAILECAGSFQEWPREGAFCHWQGWWIWIFWTKPIYDRPHSAWVLWQVW